MEFRHFTGASKGRKYRGQPGEYYSVDGSTTDFALRVFPEALGIFGLDRLAVSAMAKPVLRSRPAKSRGCGWRRRSRNRRTS
jgi:hypothetical protein